MEMKYFYVKDWAYDPTHSWIIRIAGYYTNSEHTHFFPWFGISRDEAINMIKSQEELFIKDGCYRKVRVKLIEVEGKEYLRVDYHTHPMDYLG